MDIPVKRVTIGRKVRIRNGAIVGQDMGFQKWTYDDTVFTIDAKITQNKFKLVTIGYGSDCGDNYGNGALYVKREDMLSV